MKQSLGMIEVKGFVDTITISDVMSKVANIRLISTKMTRGGGWMSIFIEGDVGAVNAAIQAGKSEAQRRGTYISSKVIARPSNGLDVMFSEDSETTLEALKNGDIPEQSTRLRDELIQNDTEVVLENISSEEIEVPEVIEQMTQDEVDLSLVDTVKVIDLTTEESPKAKKKNKTRKSKNKEK